MHLIIPFLGGLLLFSSCSRYQYVTIESSSVSKDEKHQFVMENDTLRLVYNFHGQNAPVQLEIQNKLNVPLYMNWKQSALILNGQAITYAPSDINISGSIEAAGVNYRNYAVSAGSLNAVASVPPENDFIPPLSHISKRPLSITNSSLLVRDSVIRKRPMYNTQGEPVRVKYATFNETNSPVRFRSYITFAVGEVGASQVVLEHAFYISELVNTGMTPQMFGYQNQYFGNKYFVRETTGYGRTMTGFGVIAGTAVISGAAAALECNNCR